MSNSIEFRPNSTSEPHGYNRVNPILDFPGSAPICHDSIITFDRAWVKSKIETDWFKYFPYSITSPLTEGY